VVAPTVHHRSLEGASFACGGPAAMLGDPGTDKQLLSLQVFINVGCASITRFEAAQQITCKTQETLQLLSCDCTSRIKSQNSLQVVGWLQAWALHICVQCAWATIKKETVDLNKDSGQDACITDLQTAYTSCPTSLQCYSEDPHTSLSQGAIDRQSAQVMLHTAPAALAHTWPSLLTLC
jgi:hypothetical protein